MCNITNLINLKPDNFLNVILLGGVGLNYAWGNDELKALNLPATATPLAWEKDRLNHNLRAGLRLETNQSKPIGVSLEVNANSLDDRFNSKTNDSDDWMFTAMLGLNVRFGYKKAEAQYITRMDTVYDEVEEEQPETVIVKEKKPVVKEEQKKMEEAIFFQIRESDANAAEGTDAAIKKVADLMKTSDDAKFTVTGYADKGTGNARLNKMYAEKRAADVTNKLINEHGLDASRLKTDSKGDTVQPFAENDKNRCVIIDAEGIQVTKEIIEVEE
jgi:outer membrane protein OmpA-like peptidoglycan-associated protein